MTKGSTPLTVVGIDLSLTGTGLVAWRVHAERATANMLLSTKINHDDPYDLQRRIQYIVAGIETFIGEYDRGRLVVAIENAAFMAKYSNTRQHELAGVVKYRLWWLEIRYLLFTTTALKMTATGSGKASKEEMVKAANAAGFVCHDHNVADAYWCARHAAEYVRVMA